ncbi:hypothetical protein ERC79_13370 [Rhodococcus sp. ABRD24]|nr:hypothetical protein ERC79_13370 [Rhodococcus sp. ABRD24]
MTSSGALIQPSHSSATSELPMLDDTIGDSFDRTVAAHHDRDALVDRGSGRRWTYSELAVDVDVVASGLLGLGVGKGVEAARNLLRE